MKGYFLIVSYAGLIYMGINGGLGASELIGGCIVLLFSLRRIGRVIVDGTGDVFGFAIAVAGGLFMSARSFTGRWDLSQVPQGYRLSLEAYVQAALLAHISVAVSLLVYRIVRGGRPRMPASERLVQDFPWNTAVIATALLIVARFGALSLGVGVKGAEVAVGFGALLFIVFGVVNLLATTGLLLSAVHEGDRSKIRTALLLIGADTFVVVLGGARGAIFDAALIVVLVLAVLNRKLLSAKGLIGWGFGAVFLAVGTNFALGRRVAVQDGGEFGVFEFLALRLPGTHRFAPVVDRGITVGWGEALGRPTVVKDLVYGLPETSDTGIGTGWAGLGYLADGLVGLILVSVAIGMVAGYGDRVIASTTSVVNLAFLSVLAVTFVRSYGGARPRAEIRSLMVLALAYLGVRLWIAMRRNDQSKRTRAHRTVPISTS